MRITANRRHLPQYTIFIFAFLFSCGGWAGPDKYVDFNTPYEVGDGSEDAPFDTVDEAVEVTEDGDVIRIVPGASTETITIDVRRTLVRHGTFSTVLIGSDGHVLSTGVNGGGHVTPHAGSYPAGNLEVEAVPESGWSFRRWEGGLTGSTNPYTLNLSANAFVFARFYDDALADFVVLAASTDVASGVRGDPVPVAWGVENYGGETAAAAWKDGVYLSTDEAWDEEDLFLGDETQASALTEMNTYEESLEVDIPDVAPGRYWLLVKVDIEDSVEEGVETVEDNTAVAGELLVLDPELSNE